MAWEQIHYELKYIEKKKFLGTHTKKGQFEAMLNVFVCFSVKMNVLVGKRKLS